MAGFGKCWGIYTGKGLACTGGADKSLARPGRKQANVSVRMALEFRGVLISP